MRSFWNIFSFSYIILCGIASIFAYILAPDNSRNANTMHVSIHSKPPLFSVEMLCLPTNHIPHWQDYWIGSQTMHTEIPLKSYSTNEKGIIYTIYQPNGSGGEQQFISFGKFPEENSSNILQKYIQKRTFWLGTDKYGRDMLSRMLIGARISFVIGFIAVIISLFLGIFMGALAGFYGGKIDQCILWVINVVWSIPTLLLVIALSLALGKGYWQVFVAVGLTMWVEVARVVRGQILSIKQQQYVEAARILGFSNFRIIIRHILPNIIAPLIIISASNFASAILIESGLSFLGIGAQPPTPSWGGMIKDHYNYIILGKPFLAIIPGIAILLLVLSFMLLGNKLRDILDVKN
ncbi:ABC transporter permease [Capnocytophaga catalasegens]|uniref:ABC transmembrane type-1 domain-containing protein n=1 Tax=Capnocytophaga catalasegens TaxID=1004260 RepID=A0AAV5AXL8_9FLAO|nr:ABC transporter permease [Capnocytophaga catalasegens]GIZ14469.1 hypothetical protein RCZ03_04700 [Capnocytophaga catalasegens]GJM50671.1 hypothetical protein RCZ15_16440 [Capnocytophaga catalasegens]GJM51824.1 hypothetical protein RCZ16_01420 [Capnocytophaga catalasegens]